VMGTGPGPSSAEASLWLWRQGREIKRMFITGGATQAPGQTGGCLFCKLCWVDRRPEHTILTFHTPNIT
jgi:hypothetical protein